MAIRSDSRIPRSDPQEILMRARSRFAISGFSSSLRCNQNPSHTYAAEGFQSLSGFQARCDTPTLNLFQQCFELSFNPCRVFKLVAMVSTGHLTSADNWFQSLSGFQARCDTPTLNRFAMFRAEFQSLSGFQARCDGVYRALNFGRQLVSIPVGFSSSLRFHKLYLIPYNFSKFQSLSGFQARCDIILSNRPRP